MLGSSDERASELRTCGSCLHVLAAWIAQPQSRPPGGKTGRVHQPSPTGSRRADIQGLRAVAILLVVLFHARIIFPAGFIGVDVFFVISGFVIFGLLSRQFESGRFTFHGFYRARIRRLAPAVGVLLVLVLVSAIPLLSPIDSQRDTAIVAVGGATWTANIPLIFAFGGYFDPQAETNPLLHLWSLAVEEQFYLFMPIIVWLAWRAAGRKGALIATLAVAVLSAGLLVALKVNWLAAPKSLQIAFFSSPTRAWEFAAGGVAFLGAAYWTRVSNRAANSVLAWAGALSLLIAGFWVGSEEAHPSWPVAIPVAGTCALLLAGAASPENPVSRALSTRPMTWLGDLSYSWYLWHWPLIVFALLLFRNAAYLPLVAVVALLPAYVSFRYIEAPIRSGQSIPTWSGLRVLLATSGPAILLAGIVLVGWSHSWWSKSVEAFAAQVDPLPLGVAEGCQSRRDISPEQAERCTWGSDRSGPPIYLVGDSNAGMYADGLAVAAERLNRPMVELVSPGCEPVLIPVERGQDPRCATFVASVVDYLQTARTGTVVMASANGNVRPPDSTVGPEDWSVGIADALTTVRGYGHGIVYMEQIPQFPEPALDSWWHPDTCSLVTTVRQTADCGMTLPRDLAADQDAIPRKAERLGLEAAGVTAVPTVPRLCTPTTCSTNDSNYWTYRDGLHLSVQESKQFAPTLEQAVLDAR